MNKPRFNIFLEKTLVLTNKKKKKQIGKTNNWPYLNVFFQNFIKQKATIGHQK